LPVPPLPPRRSPVALLRPLLAALAILGFVLQGAVAAGPAAVRECDGAAQHSAAGAAGHAEHTVLGLTPGHRSCCCGIACAATLVPSGFEVAPARDGERLEARPARVGSGVSADDISRPPKRRA
jgi:hypothetical protein